MDEASPRPIPLTPSPHADPMENRTVSTPPLLFRHGIGLLLSLLLWGCVSDAPRVNPLDPDGEAPALAGITGRVERFYANTGIANAMITVLPDQIVTTSDAQGNYRIAASLFPGDYTVVCTVGGYAPDTVRLSLSAGEAGQADFRLNALPVFSSARLLTRRETGFINPETRFLEYAVEVDDADGDGDISRVTVTIPGLAYRDTLTRISAQEATFTGRLQPARLGLGGLEALEGHPFHFQATDLPGDSTDSGPRYISRLIEVVPVGDAPTGSATPPFDFEWTSVFPPYPFTYRVEIYQNVAVQLPPERVLEGIPSDTTRWGFSGPLPSGNYYWVLYVEDDFGNTSRSLPKAITIP